MTRGYDSPAGRCGVAPRVNIRDGHSAVDSRTDAAGSVRSGHRRSDRRADSIVIAVSGTIDFVIRLMRRFAMRRRVAAGVRQFMVEPRHAQCRQRVLREGYQRQRNAAALRHALLRPGSPLFPTAAPARRQQRRLAQTA